MNHLAVVEGSYGCHKFALGNLTQVLFVVVYGVSVFVPVVDVALDRVEAVLFVDKDSVIHSLSVMLDDAPFDFFCFHGIVNFFCR